MKRSEASVAESRLRVAQITNRGDAEARRHSTKKFRVPAAPEIEKFVGSAMGSAFGAPTSVLASPFAMPSARSVAFVRIGVTAARCRPSQPVAMRGSRGFPTSMNRWASKCDRDGSIDPVACTTRRLPAWYAGSSPPIACGNAKFSSSAR